MGAKRVKHLRTEIFLVSLEIVAQMLDPYSNKSLQAITNQDKG